MPQPKVYWLRNGSPLETVASSTPASSVANGIPNDVTAANSFVQTGDGHLTLGRAELRHQGNYSCVAENIAARRVSEPAVLTVYGEIYLHVSARADEYSIGIANASERASVIRNDDRVSRDN